MFGPVVEVPDDAPPRRPARRLDRSGPAVVSDNRTELAVVRASSPDAPPRTERIPVDQIVNGQPVIFFSRGLA